MKTSLLQVPYKKSEDVNWYKPLNNYLLSIYGNTSDYQQDLTAFNKLRSDLRGVHADATGVKLALKYYSQLELIDLRIPFQLINTPTKTRVEFVWYDSFDPEVRNAQGSLAFEKANVLYQLGSLLSRQAAVKYSNGSTKDAIALQTQAAGVFEFIGDNFLHAPSPDLAGGSIKFLAKLSMAQASELFVLQAISADTGQKMNALVSKLCQGVSEQYETAYTMAAHMSADPDPYGDTAEAEEFLEQPEDLLPTVSIVLEPRWLALCDFKRAFYASLALYFHALQLDASRKYGEAIAYLTKCQEALTKDVDGAVSAANQQDIAIGYELLDYLQSQEDIVKIKLEEMHKDNDLVYNDLVPSTTTLAAIKPKSACEPTPLQKLPQMQEISDHNYSNFLPNVVPINIHELLSYYSEEKSQFLRNEIDLVEVSNQEMASVLEHLKLPHQLGQLKELAGSQAAAGSGPQIAGRTTQMAQEISAGFQDDAKNRQAIEQLRQRIYHQMATASGDDVINLKRALYQATTNDTKLFELINDGNRELYTILGEGRVGELFQPKVDLANEVSLLDLDDRKPREIDDQIAQVEKMLAELNRTKSAKTHVIKTLKEQIHADDISDILILNSRVKSTKEIKQVIFPEELKKFDPAKDELDALVEQQAAQLAELTRAYAALQSHPEVGKVQSSKQFQEELVRSQSERIAQFYPEWRQYHTGLARGVAFYNKLLSWAHNLTQPPSHAHATAGPSAAPGPGPTFRAAEGSPSGQTQQQPAGSLIYDQPSTYQPNMYNFFSKQ
ncbi:vacuolar-sorting protein Bro1p [Diutina catenulata]